MNPFPQDGLEKIKKKLFQSAMKSEWEDVIKTYKENKESYTAKITSSGDTALHIAVSNEEESFVERLVEIVQETEGALEAQNDLGNTPLHLAAYLGNATMCTCIVSTRNRKKLMGIRNDDNETPFFLAVRHGRKEAFQALNRFCEDGEGYNYCKKNDGETILHSALTGEYFELAYDIMNHYDKLLNAVNEQGFSALHILANKPSAFRSGSQIRGLDKLIYHCIFVDELEHDTMHNKSGDLQYKKDSNYPGNYHTCVTTFRLLWDIMRVLLGKKHDDEDTKKHDEENTPEHQHKPQTPKATQQDHEDHPKCHQLMVNVICGTRKANAERHQFQRATQGRASN